MVPIIVPERWGDPTEAPCIGSSVSEHSLRITAEILGQLGQAASFLLGFGGIWVALWNQRRQQNAQIFIEFSGRFQQILRLFPTEAWLANRNPAQPLPPTSQELTDCTLYCVQFVADAFYLHKGGYISRSIWKLWEREIQRTLSGPLFLREWEKVSPEFSHAPEFLRYIEGLMRPKPPRRAFI